MSAVHPNISEDDDLLSERPASVVGRATWSDVFEIAALTRAGAPHCIALEPVDALMRVAEFDVVKTEGGLIVACVALRDLQDGRGELRSLAVHADYRGFGLGRRLVQQTIHRARARGLDLVCVTTHPAFFERLGFRTVPLDSIPKKRGRGEDLCGERCALEYQKLEPTTWVPRSAAAAH